ncbi:hypothetical protein LOK49_LG07G02069 [Camellia lanceoleosa]|uniref:Uncharacterized protein n=1 Tax=Camellia lanceoleosa TaxID=1840588 RepID=A0ACC0H365_9ERIC|nr:hypothetical protein LOK49_LG07G02069 [Camellia lanceoleosa]
MGEEGDEGNKEKKGEKLEREIEGEACGGRGGPPMDTTDRSWIATALSKFDVISTPKSLSFPIFVK